MPHIIVKLYAGRSGQEKARLAGEITKAFAPVLKYGEDAVSMGIEDIEPRREGLQARYSGPSAYVLQKAGIRSPCLEPSRFTWRGSAKHRPQAQRRVAARVKQVITRKGRAPFFQHPLEPSLSNMRLHQALGQIGKVSSAILSDAPVQSVRYRRK
jgi:phenylpyruvate tautomerase PptA (4-oxalocrotonate tautomerase family)